MAQRKLEVVITGDPRRAKAAMGEVEGRAGKMRGKLSKIGKGVAVGIASGGIALAAGAGVLLKGAYDAAIESQKITKETERVIKTTGGAAKVSAKHVGAYAGTLSKLTGVDDEAIQSGSNLLLTFTNIRNEVGKGNDIFDRATAMAVDMSTALGTDVKASSIQLGKALNDPIKGITALSKAGVSFTKDQKAQIKWLAASGDQLGAQKIILGELNKEFGGAAATAATPMDRLKVSVGNLQEELGAKLIPVVGKVADWLAARLPGALAKVQEWGARLAAWWRENWPAIQAAIAVVVEWFTTTALPKIRAFIDGAVEKFRQIVAWVRENWPAFQEAITHVLSVIQAYWDRFGSKILANVRSVWNIVYAVIKIGINLISGIIRTVTAIINGDWGKAWNTIKQTFSRVWGAIPGILRNVMEIVKNVIGAGMKLAKDKVTGVLNSIVGWFRDMPGRLARVGSGMFSFIKQAFKSAVNWIIDKWNGLEFKVPKVGPIGGQTIGTPNIPRLHSGGVFRAPKVGGEGLALLRDGERISTPNREPVTLTPADDRDRSTNGAVYIDKWYAGTQSPDEIARSMSWLQRTRRLTSAAG